MIEWIFILTLGITLNTEVDVSFVAKTEADCWKGRAEVMATTIEAADEYLYWYITACERSSRS